MGVVMSFEFIKELPPQKRSEIEEFLETFQPKNLQEEKILLAIRVHFELIKKINEEITLVEASRMLSSEAYTLIKKFGKEVEVKSLREIKRELIEDITRLQNEII